MPPERHETQPFRTKWTLDVKNWGKIAILVSPSQPFHTKWTLDVKNCGEIAILRCHGQPLHAKWRFDVKNWGKIAIKITWPIATLSHEMDVGRRKLM